MTPILGEILGNFVVRFSLSFIILGVLNVGLICPKPILGAGPSTPSPQPSLPKTSLLYVSDYASFVGEDAHGRVAFALDNNRGRDGETWQAEHFVVLHDEHEGWVPLQGSGSYDNTTHELETIPSSSFFSIDGMPQTGMTIDSPSNNLTLSIKPIPIRLAREHEGGRYWLGSASAELQWKNRRLKGRVIYEYFMMPEFNRLSRTYWGLWKHFQGLYLVVEGLGDLYVHSQESDMMAPLVGTVAGFLAVKGETKSLQVLQVTLLDHNQAWGLYRWPSAWGLNWVNKSGAGRARLEIQEFKTMGNWIIGGFGMGIVHGLVHYNGKEYFAYGLAELIM